MKLYVGIFRKISGIFFCNDWNRRSKLPQRRGNFDRIFELFFQPTYMPEFPDFWKKMFYLSYSVYILRHSSSMISLNCQSKKNVKKRSKLPQLTVCTCFSIIYRVSQKKLPCHKNVRRMTLTKKFSKIF